MCLIELKATVFFFFGDEWLKVNVQFYCTFCHLIKVYVIGLIWFFFLAGQNEYFSFSKEARLQRTAFIANKKAITVDINSNKNKLDMRGSKRGEKEFCIKSNLHFTFI